MGEQEPAPGPAAPSGDDLLPGGARRFAPLIAGVVVGLALVGFLRGIGDRPAPPRAAPPAARPVGAAPPAARYDELPHAGLRANAGWKSDLRSLAEKGPGPFDPVTRTEAMKDEALADRARHRAFDGAPPTVPHPIEQQSSASCLACHGTGLKVGDRVATRVSHPPYGACTACHVEQTRGGLPWEAGGTENTFAGLMRAGPGERAFAGAPPTVPHTTWMREDCLSCHGLVARPGLRTTHPHLSSCLQCHAPSAGLDQAGLLPRQGGGR